MRDSWRSGGGGGGVVLDKEWKAEAAHYEKLEVRPSDLDHSTVTDILPVLTLGLDTFW